MLWVKAFHIIFMVTWFAGFDRCKAASPLHIPQLQ